MTGARSLDPRTPVLVGAGTASADAESPELMARALEAAVADAGAPSIMPAIDRIAVPQGTWSYPDPARLVAHRVGAGRARTHLTELGIPQQVLINEALSAILAGASEVAAVVGGEARRWARRPEAAAETAQPGARPDEIHHRHGPLLEPVEEVHRLWDPVQQYAMIDNALRHADGKSLAAHRGEIAELWARFNRVASTYPGAAFPAPLTAREIDTPSPGNRPLAFPYNKWHSTQWTVDQAAALVFCSAEAATRLGVDGERWVHPLAGLHSSHAVSLLRRRQPHTWPAVEVLGAAAASRMGRPLAAAEIIELYSCFPAAVRVQQRALSLDGDGTPTITGGMAFAGGPFNNFVLQATAAMAAAIRARPAALGVVTTVSGLLTKPGIGVWSGRSDGRPPLLADLADAVRSKTEVMDVIETLEEYRGPATVVTYTATFDGLDPVRTIALCDTDDGRRCVALSDDSDLAARVVAEEFVGCPVLVDRGTLRV
jgi:acetyl-CoA C-acetyltransferase